MILFSTRLRRWLMFIVVAPLLGRFLQLLAAAIAKRNEASRSAPLLSRAGGVLRSRGRS
jgi:hypothetical protein